jgi:hypothetical protein
MEKMKIFYGKNELLNTKVLSFLLTLRYRENLAIESLILSMPMATKFDQRKKIKKLAKLLHKCIYAHKIIKKRMFYFNK